MSKAPAALASAVSTKSSASTSSSRVGRWGELPEEGVLMAAAEGVTDGTAAAHAAVGDVEGEDAADVEGDDAADEEVAATAATAAMPRGAVSVERTSSRMLGDGGRGWRTERRNRRLGTGVGKRRGISKKQ